ncbi:MAG: hypothetical protein J6N93_04315 [Clostridia bacterium]|nr:hypothetical protein [Clostridia bacterium]
MGNVSLLSGSSVKGVSVTGATDEVVTLADNGSDAATLNLKGSGSEAFVTVKGTVHSSSVVSGFNSLIFDATKVTSDSTEVSLDGGVRDSNVSILGGKDVDTVVIGANTRSSDILINGGEGADVISLSGTGYETLVLGKDHGTDTVTYWAEAVGGDTSKGNTISIEGAIDTFLVSTVEGGYANVSVGSAGATFSGDGATIHSSESDDGVQLGINITTKDDTYSALLVGSKALDEKLGTKFDKFDYIIADSKQTLNLGKTNKKTVVLANELDEKHWGDTNVYQNVVTVKASSAGGSMIVNGKGEAAYLEANGKNDSIWGGANSVGDTIALGDATNAKIFTGVNDGADSLISYSYAPKAANANAVYFLDGVGHIAADEKSLTIGANEENNMVIQVDSASSTGDKVAYGFGTDSDKYVAMVDMTKRGDAGIAYGSDVKVYIGQGDTYIDIASGTKDVKLGWDGGAGYVSIGGVNAALAADGAVVVGTTDNAQSITGSSKGASSISGGFVADKWTDENDDTLVGGGIASKSTTFFVGKEMGKDVINDLSSKDNIVFLGTKYADLAKALTLDTSDSYITFEFSNGNKIEANLVGSKKMKDLSDVSLYFDDGTYIWNGSTLEKAE